MAAAAGAGYPKTTADCLLPTAHPKDSMPPASAEDTGILAGTPEFRKTNIAVFSCGFSIFAILYCPQPVLPQLVQ